MGVTGCGNSEWSTGTIGAQDRCRGEVLRGQRKRLAIDARVSIALTDPGCGRRKAEDELRFPGHIIVQPAHAYTCVLVHTRQLFWSSGSEVQEID